MRCPRCPRAAASPAARRRRRPGSAPAGPSPAPPPSLYPARHPNTRRAVLQRTARRRSVRCAACACMRVRAGLHHAHSRVCGRQQENASLMCASGTGSCCSARRERAGGRDYIFNIILFILFSNPFASRGSALPGARSSPTGRRTREAAGRRRRRRSPSAHRDSPAAAAALPCHQPPAHLINNIPPPSSSEMLFRRRQPRSPLAPLQLQVQSSKCRAQTAGKPQGPLFGEVDTSLCKNSCKDDLWGRPAGRYHGGFFRRRARGAPSGLWDWPAVVAMATAASERTPQ